ncbi:MAG: head-tail adaptor protein [Chloroflexi bacterium]|nr:MAG: head-tail adaptor protein [Chloroflexota bacterium]
MVRQLISSARLTALKDFFPSAGTVQTSAKTRASSGQQDKTWSNLADHVDIACRVSPAGGREMRKKDQTVATMTHTIALQGHYPSITSQMRFVVESLSYDILLVDHDGQKTYTRLKCEVVY